MGGRSRGHISAERNLVDIALFVAFFPQLVAGPILRASHFLPQLAKEPIIREKNVANGIFMILLGLFLKDVLADNIASRVNYLFGNWQSNGIMDNWVAGMLFGVQIYGAFNGYSLIAIGIAKILGFEVLKNFNAPYHMQLQVFLIFGNGGIFHYQHGSEIIYIYHSGAIVRVHTELT